MDPNHPFIKKLEKGSSQVAVFIPYNNAQAVVRMDKNARTSIPVTDRDIFFRRSMGPVITIYQLEER